MHTLRLAAAHDEEEALPTARTIAAPGDAMRSEANVGTTCAGAAMAAGLDHLSPAERTQPAMNWVREDDMGEMLLVSTRKGLFWIKRRHGRWGIDRADFLGDNVTLTLSDPRNGRHYAALDHGHFGVKVHRSSATGWEEIAAPVYPPKPEGVEENDAWGRPLAWSTARIWALAAGGADEPGVLWCGTLPGGLFRSSNDGESWEMVRPLWDHPKRKMWMGGGGLLPTVARTRSPGMLTTSGSSGSMPTWNSEARLDGVSSARVMRWSSASVFSASPGTTSSCAAA